MEKTAAQRIVEIIGQDSLADVSRKLALLAGVPISPQGIHKWTKDGEIPEPSLLAFCKAYGVSPAYVRYGITDDGVTSEWEKALRQLAAESMALVEGLARNQETPKSVKRQTTLSPIKSRVKNGANKGS